MKLSLIDSKSRRRIIRHWPLLCALLFLLAPASHGQTTPPDVPSGFMPGIINYFAGNGTSSPTVTDGSVPTQVSVGAFPTATDSQGNVYIAGSSVIYIVYGGNGVPGALANVTTKATSQLTPQKGRIYTVAGFGSMGCGACEGLPLDQVNLVSIGGLAIDSQDNLYYSDGENGNYRADVVREVAFATSNVTTVAGQWGVESSGSNIGDGGLAIGTSASLYIPVDIKLDQYGNLFIDDNYNDVVRVVYIGSQPPPILTAENITVGPSQKGFIYSVAGQVDDFCTASSCAGDGSSAATYTGSAALGYEESIGVDTTGNLYVADSTSGGNYIRVVYAGGAVPTVLNQYLNPNGGTSVSPQNGYIYPVTGYAVSGYGPCASAGCGDNGLASGVVFGNSNIYLTLDGLGNLYVADVAAHAVRKIDTSGYASVIAGIDDPAQTPPAKVPVPDGGLRFAS
jgi:hypothetical protein